MTVSDLLREAVSILIGESEGHRRAVRPAPRGRAPHCTHPVAAIVGVASGCGVSPASTAVLGVVFVLVRLSASPR